MRNVSKNRTNPTYDSVSGGGGTGTGIVSPSNCPSPENEGDHVFICHSKDDADPAEVCKLRLEKHGFPSWFDQYSLVPGVDYREEIDEAVTRCFAFILILTPNSLVSPYVTYEWVTALKDNKSIISLMFEPTKPHPLLEKYHYLDFTSIKSRPWDELIRLLIQLRKHRDENS